MSELERTIGRIDASVDGLIRERDALRVEVAKWKHEAEACDPEECELDHEPRSPGSGVDCPWGCTSSMVSSYVDTHRGQCPALMAKAVDAIQGILAEADRDTAAFAYAKAIVQVIRMGTIQPEAFTKAKQIRDTIAHARRVLRATLQDLDVLT